MAGMADGIHNHAEKATSDRRSGCILHLRTQGSALSIWGRIKKVQGIEPIAGVGASAKKKITPRDSFAAKNSDVHARALKDKLQLKAVKDGLASYAALEKKAEVYDKLVTGELSDEEDRETYCVDLFLKGTELESQWPQGSDVLTTAPPDNEEHEDDGSIPFNMKFVGPGLTSGAMDNNEHKRFVR